MSEFNEKEFLQGQKDCASGVPHKDGSDSYNRGYAVQYEMEQIQSVLSMLRRINNVSK